MVEHKVDGVTHECTNGVQKLATFLHYCCGIDNAVGEPPAGPEPPRDLVSGMALRTLASSCRALRDLIRVPHTLVHKLS